MTDASCGYAIPPGRVSALLPPISLAGGVGVAVGGLAYVVLAARTLAYTLVDPTPSRTTLPVLP